MNSDEKIECSQKLQSVVKAGRVMEIVLKNITDLHAVSPLEFQ